MKPETRSKEMTVRKADRPTTTLAKRDMGRGSISQKQRQAYGNQQGFSRSTQEKQGTFQKPAAENIRADRKKFSSATSMQKQTKKYSERNANNRKYGEKQSDSKTTSSFDRYQPYSKQERSDTHVAKQYTKSSEQAVKSNSGKTSYPSKSRYSLQNSKRQEPRKAYTSRSSSAPRLTQRQAQGSYKSATPPKRESQRTYVSRGSNSSQYSRSSGGKSSRGFSSSPGYKSQPTAGVSRGFSRAPSMDFGRR